MAGRQPRHLWRLAGAPAGALAGAAARRRGAPPLEAAAGGADAARPCALPAGAGGRAGPPAGGWVGRVGRCVALVYMYSIYSQCTSVAMLCALVRPSMRGELVRARARVRMCMYVLVRAWRAKGVGGGGGDVCVCLCCHAHPGRQAKEGAMLCHTTCTSRAWAAEAGSTLCPDRPPTRMNTRVVRHPHVLQLWWCCCFCPFATVAAACRTWWSGGWWAPAPQRASRSCLRCRPRGGRSPSYRVCSMYRVPLVGLLAPLHAPLTAARTCACCRWRGRLAALRCHARV